ncbi:MOSC domain-containing protein [Actinocrinis puniceicyclus]|uniref:MOSC domain-containing protein n=1 Tax=Actinocrinis puniceicyclus TaxID=977794 RepID=A0A8J7WGX6_9ACTN|nr:MOSC N-terminal beta barrel domain-containing protein [Actinocrinis puniceicyclus]MBS2962056.1 MOSC domain-containing protein [Actinocrinis puniceicyclus]
MYVKQLWRYPVKSLRGEMLTQAEFTAGGLGGDRVIHVRRRNQVLTARTRHGLLGLAGTTDQEGRVLINGRPWDDPRSADLVRFVAGADADLACHAGPERFDVLPLLVATDGGIDALGRDGRRLRPNIVIGAVPGLAERDWPGRALRIGETLLGVDSLRGRCVVTTIDPDTGRQDLEVLRRIIREFDGTMALNCWVAHGGRIRQGDPVELVDASLEAPDAGGWIRGVPYLVP